MGESEADSFLPGLGGVNLEEQLPELTEEVTIEHLRLQLTVDADNRLQGVQGKLEVSGKDKAGVIHRVKMEGEGGISGINATTLRMGTTLQAVPSRVIESGSVRRPRLRAQYGEDLTYVRS